MLDKMKHYRERIDNYDAETVRTLIEVRAEEPKLKIYLKFL